jgi:hypothetical protein
MVVVGEFVLWPYVEDLNDSEHHSSIMIWKPGTKPKVWITSDYPSSDYMLYTEGTVIYIIERRYNQSVGQNEQRVLKGKIGEKPEVIWTWFRHDKTIGEGGFMMLNDEELVFGSYPGIYLLKKGGKVSTEFRSFNVPVSSMRPVNKSHFLVSVEEAIWLVDVHKGVVQEWSNLIDESVDNAPLNRNSIFGVDYQNGELIFAYWGNRSFDLIDDSGRKTLIKLEEPLVPHWVAFYGNRKLLFASRLIFDGRNPEPYLLLFKNEDEVQEIWKKWTD